MNGIIGHQHFQVENKWNDGRSWQRLRPSSIRQSHRLLCFIRVRRSSYQPDHAENQKRFSVDGIAEIPNGRQLGSNSIVSG